jgi:hypothetical protein
LWVLGDFAGLLKGWSLMETEVAQWLSERLFAELDADKVSAWIIGSIAAGASHPEDCDVLLLTDRGCVSRIAQLSPIWRSECELEFGIPLHLTRLTTEEAKDCTQFLNSVFGKAYISIGSPELGHDACTGKTTSMTYAR